VIKKYTEEEDSIIINNYEYCNKNAILELLPGRNWMSIYNRAFKLNIKRSIYKQNLLPLLDKTAITYYWLGFLISDGHFSKNNVLHININKLDLKHLCTFCEFLNLDRDRIKIKNNIIRLSISDVKTIPVLKQKFDIKSNKTYNAICFDFDINGDLLKCFLIGLIDGDGSINKKHFAYITAHKSWDTFYDKFQMGKIYYTKNILRYVITKSSTSILKNIIDKYNLPVLSRKWDKVNIINKNNKIEHIISMFSNGLSVQHIKKTNNYSLSCIYKAKVLYDKAHLVNYLNKVEQNNIKKKQFVTMYIEYTKIEVCKKLQISTSSYNRWKREDIKKRDVERDMKRNGI